jgi:hypothetical protein
MLSRNGEFPSMADLLGNKIDQTDVKLSLSQGDYHHVIAGLAVVLDDVWGRGLFCSTLK